MGIHAGMKQFWERMGMGEKEGGEEGMY